MSNRTLALYVSASGTLAMTRGSGLAPLVSAHDDLSQVDWSALASALREEFGTVRVQLLLSAKQCRYLVLPWLSSRYTGAAIRDYVAEAFTATASVSSTSHLIEIDWPPYGEPILAAAYPRTIVDTLRDGLAAAGLGLLGVEGSIGPVLRRYGRMLDTTQALLAYAEDDGITGITVEAGKVVQIESLPCEADGLDQIAVWASRKQFAFDDDDRLCWLATASKPDAYAGRLIPVESSVVPVCAGHAVALAWQ